MPASLDDSNSFPEPTTSCTLLLLAFLLFSVFGCSRHSVQPADGMGPATRLARAQKLYVALSQDGRYGNTGYPGSGGSVSRMLADALKPYTASVVTSGTVEPQEIALQSARAVGARYLIMPNILHWEDRNTPWSGLLDHVKVELAAYDVETGASLGSKVIAANNQWATFRNNPPDVLLPQPLAEYARALFQ